MYNILVAVAGAAFAAYVLVKKYVDSKKVVIGNDAENYVFNRPKPRLFSGKIEHIYRILYTCRC